MPTIPKYLRDASGWGNHGLNYAGFETDPWLLNFDSSFDAALDFDGANDYMTFDAQPTLLLSRGFSWTCWVEFDALTVQRLIGHVANPGYFVSCNGATPAKCTFGKVGIEHTVISATTLTTGTIYNVMVTVGDATLPFVTLYLNGEVDASGTMSSGAIVPTGAFQMSDSAFFMNGRLWNVACWHRCLSQGEVWSYYRNPGQVWSENDPDVFFQPGPAETAVSKDCQGMHEARGAILQTASGVHEGVSSFVSQTAVGMHEALQSVPASTATGFHEALQRSIGAAAPFIYRDGKRRLR